MGLGWGCAVCRGRLVFGGARAQGFGQEGHGVGTRARAADTVEESSGVGGEYRGGV